MTAIPYRALLDSLCVHTGAYFGLALVDRLLETDTPLPVVIDRGKYRIWIDKYYMAYQKYNGRVRYLYATAAHVREELTGWKLAGKAPDEGIYRQLILIGTYMRRHKTNLWVSKKLHSEHGRGHFDAFAAVGGGEGCVEQ